MAHPMTPTMRAALFDRYGEPDVLRIQEIPVPPPGEGEVLIRVHASGLNPVDALIRSGSLRLVSGRKFPRGTGMDFAGEVVTTGPGVDDLAEGVAVWGFLGGSVGAAAADYVVASREWVARMPAGIGWAEAGALPLVGSTALQALRDVAELREDERLLIRGASGGVGSAAIQIARGMGGRVTAIASTPNLDYCRSLGARETIDYSTTDPTSLEERFDVFLDCVGKSPVLKWGRLLAKGGRWVAVAPSPRVYALGPFTRILPRAAGVPKLLFVIARPVRSDLEELSRLVERGELHMPVTSTYRLDEIRKAHEDAAERHGRGKSVIIVSDAAREEAGAKAPGE